MISVSNPPGICRPTKVTGLGCVVKSNESTNRPSRNTLSYTSSAAFVAISNPTRVIGGLNDAVTSGQHVAKKLSPTGTPEPGKEAPKVVVRATKSPLKVTPWAAYWLVICVRFGNPVKVRTVAVGEKLLLSKNGAARTFVPDNERVPDSKSKDAEIASSVLNAADGNADGCPAAGSSRRITRALSSSFTPLAGS